MTYRTAPASNASPPPRAAFRIIEGAHRVFPRRHPSATMCAILAAVTLLGGGPFVGVPAIILSRLVAREIASAPWYRGANWASASLVMAWAGSIFYPALGVLLVARRSSDATYAALTAGILLAVLGVAGMALEKLEPLRILRAHKVQILSAALAFASAGLGGAAWRASDARIVAARCHEHLEKANVAVEEGSFDAARDSLAKAGAVCVGHKLGEVASNQQQVDAAERQHDAWLESERKRKLVERFDGSVAGISGNIDAAVEHAKKKDWKSADSELTTAAETLQAYANTVAADLGEFEALTARVAKEKKALEPGLAALRKQELAEAEAQRKREEAEEKRQEAIREREAAQRAWAERKVVCSDGWVSSCECSRPSKRGCCSHHGGIAGCQ